MIEDEEQVRKFLCGVLAEQGYTILQARNGEEAIDVTRRPGPPIDLVLSDLVMPRLDGRQAVLHVLKAVEPFKNVKLVLFMSGDAVAETADALKGRNGRPAWASDAGAESANKESAYKRSAKKTWSCKSSPVRATMPCL